MGISVRALLREKGTPYKELGLDDPKWTDEQLIDQCSRIRSSSTGRSW